jgi:hypothetical protein
VNGIHEVSGSIPLGSTNAPMAFRLVSYLRGRPRLPDDQGRIAEVTIHARVLNTATILLIPATAHLSGRHLGPLRPSGRPANDVIFSRDEREPIGDRDKLIACFDLVGAEARFKLPAHGGHK